ncbi:MAG: hypothetical protein HYW25_01530 [Candidatus Aenigmarchaeota archaeon]|nr:hypothetical protein [Candidatus Aenigmarchaeota archaeon]
MKRSHIFLAAGVLLIAFISAIEGHSLVFIQTIAHLQEDLREWSVHLYILGWILLAYGLYKIFRKK